MGLVFRSLFRGLEASNLEAWPSFKFDLNIWSSEASKHLKVAMKFYFFRNTLYIWSPQAPVSPTHPYGAWRFKALPWHGLLWPPLLLLPSLSVSAPEDEHLFWNEKWNISRKFWKYFNWKSFLVYCEVSEAWNNIR